MSQRKPLTISMSIVMAVFVLFLGAMARPGRTRPSTIRPTAGLPYSQRGPNPVGVRHHVIDGDTPLEISMWYPTLNEGSRAGAIQYPYEIKIDTPFGTVAVATFKGQAMPDAPYDLSSAPYPLVILSPGFSIGASTYAWLAEHLASYGFVVIAPDHQERLDPELDSLWQATISRPQDILAVMAYVDEQVEAGGALEGLIDNEVVAVIGHSYGGYTALAAAGAKIDTRAFEAHCAAAHEADDSAAWLCDELLPNMASMAALAGFDSVPEGLWPAWADPRVDAIVPLAGDAFMFGQAGLAEIDVPVMAIGGTLDSDAPYLWGTHPAYEYVSSPRKVRIALTDAEHMVFAGQCESIPPYMRFFSGEFCADANWDRGHAHGLVGHFTTAFLLAELGQDAEAAAALAPDAVDFPDLTYDAQGY
jgi:predicted dienelactone hydrolase